MNTLDKRSTWDITVAIEIIKNKKISDEQKTIILHDEMRFSLEQIIEMALIAGDSE